ncbi:MAG: zf-TFIIB domain-containing protein [Pirellulaceae bacterium]|jgi:Zn-finger nucleic acid-binding protein|nr:zf-TFIIB domain-containing protein [Pirellulaceae bacterium]
MRLFVACPDCDQKYKVAADKLGKRFRCHCGHVLEVRESKGHEASVIRCSSCGSAREKGSNRCGYCDADFTIHERDLHTVCPKCLTRVSDKAKYCQHCATKLTGEHLAEDFSQLACPLCGPERLLSNRRLGQEQVSVLECSICAGLWLGIDAFERLRERVLNESAQKRALLRHKPRPSKLRRHVGPTYRPCIHCGKTMHRQQYARGSGVIIDVCREHGIWFDEQELQQILDWTVRGGTRKKQLKPDSQATDPPADKPPSRLDRTGEPQTNTPPDDYDCVDIIVGGLLESVATLFHFR